MKHLKIILSLILITMISVAGFAAGAADGSEIVTIPLLQREGGSDANTVVTNAINAMFEEKYAGKYVLEIERVPGMAEELRQKLKVLGNAGQLPAVVTDLATEAAWAEELMAAGRLLDLKPYFDADPEWQKMVYPKSVEYNTKDGKMFSSPGGSDTYVGIYYNMELFAKAGIDEFPSTWEGFFNAADRLKAAGITPIALHTTETGWCTNLMLSTYLARNQEGRDFMEITYPTDEFTSAAFIDGVEFVKRLYNYTYPDAIGGNYALAANKFTSGEVAMIPNGPWMIGSFSDPEFSSEGFEEKVGYARYPGNVMISNQGMSYGLGVSMDHDLAVQEGAVEYIKFVSASREPMAKRMVEQGYMTPFITLTDAELAELGPVMKTYASILGGIEHMIPWFQKQWDPINQGETIVQQLPNLLYGNISAREYAEALRDSAKQYLASRE